MTATAVLEKIIYTTREEHLLVSGLSVVALLALLPFIGADNYVLHVAVLVFVYAGLGLGLNIVVGLAGLLDLGYIAFYAVGAYSYALLSAHYQIPFLAAIFVGAMLSAVIGVILGWPTIRSRGDYLALVTLGFGEMIRLLLRNSNSLTNGPRGIMDVPAPRVIGFTFSTPVQSYYLGLLLVATSVVVFWRVKYSAAGQQLIAIRDDEGAAESIGINPVRWKLYAFALGAFVAGLAGVFFASWQRFVSPESFTLGESILVLSIVVVGGMGRLWPTVGAAALLVLLPEALRGLETYRILVLGILLVLIVSVQERIRLAATHRRRADESRKRKSTEALTSIDDARSFDNAARFTSGEFILSVSELSKHFGGIKALERASLRVRPGEVLGLIGSNGAGKTTLFDCMSGATRPDGGRIDLYGGESTIEVSNLSFYQTARLGLVRTFQQPRPFKSLTALENVQLGARCRDIPKLWDPFFHRLNGQATARARAVLMLSAIGGPAPETPVSDMGFVDQKLTELARALAAGPSLLLLDEPASGMEASARERLAKALRWANEDLGITLIIVEHDLLFLSSICHRLAVLVNGEVKAIGGTDDPDVTRALQESYQLNGE